MTKHNYILFITILSFLVTLSACKAQPTPEYVPEGAERDSITADADIFARHIQDGMETKDFILFSKDFDSAMLNAMTSASFEKLYKQFEGFFPSSSLELIKCKKPGIFSRCATWSLTQKRSSLCVWWSARPNPAR
ncbi:MAG: hypothetical protein FD147_1882 [Chloroflexi bacterium]|nr:MAG: hypothetical protein FD147_1882 [Chloroflexota bacterium]